ncbi:MAG: BtpA/SgcQ family protein [Candidatus Rokubacteria bacterium]|nr:BtpA/SgcQ family protein [Candidatus Rokubacteria bacterium]
MSGLVDLFGVDRALIGMVHLLPLPGSPRWGGSMEKVVERTLADARALAGGGMDALLVENHGDAPFSRERVDAGTVAAMARVIAELRCAVPLPLGVSVLKNDALSALALAVAVGARFIRVNVHTGAVLADQGIIQSDAAATLRYRRLLDADVKIFADVQAKHGVPLAPVELEQEARDSVARGLADALVVSGKATGEATPLEDVKRVRSAVRDVPLLVGSGVTPESVAELLSVADGAIVGTWLKRDGRLGNPVDPERVKRFVEAARAR